MQNNPLKEEIEFFKSIKTELLARATGEYALIHGKELIGTFKAEEDALKRGYELFGNLPFLVQQIVEFEEVLDFTHNFMIAV